LFFIFGDDNQQCQAMSEFCVARQLKTAQSGPNRRLNTFRVFSEYAERMKNTQKEIFTFNNAWGLKSENILKKFK
jgi:hypothetical protein